MHVDDSQALDALHMERRGAFYARWQEDMRHVLCEGKDVWRTRSSAHTAHEFFVRARAHGAVARLVFPKKPWWRSQRHVKLAPHTMSHLLVWMYTSEMHPTLVDDLARDAHMHRDEMQACLVPIEDDVSEIVGSMQTGEGAALFWSSILRRCPGLEHSAACRLPPLAQHQLHHLLLAGRLASFKSAHDLEPLVDVLHKCQWAQAADLVTTCALVTQPEACAGILSRCSDLACLDAVRRSGAFDASGDTCLAFIDAVRRLDNREADAALIPLLDSARIDAIVASDAWPATLSTCRPVLGYILHLCTSQLDVHNAPRVYELVVGHIQLAEHAPIVHGAAFDLVESARHDILQCLHRNWMHMRRVHAFDGLPRWCVKELSAELDVDATALTESMGPPSRAGGSDAQSTVGVTSAGLGVRPPEHRGPSSMYAAVLNRRAAAIVHT